MPTTKGTHDRDRLNRRASNAALIAVSRTAIARGRRLVETSDQLMRTSARLMPRSSLEAPPQMPSERERQAEADEAAGRQANAERCETVELRRISHALRSYVEELVVTSQEIRWEARQIQMQSRALRARALQVRARTRNTVEEATYRVIVDGLSDYGVEVIGAHHFQSALGFPTQMDALRWIADQKAAGDLFRR
jgi:hypothetical protein